MRPGAKRRCPVSGSSRRTPRPRASTSTSPRTATRPTRIITKIAKDSDCKKIVKSKSMTAEETLLNHDLEDAGLEVTETDLGEWIIQLRHEGPSHMVMPAIHLSRHQVGDLFSEVTGTRSRTVTRSRSWSKWPAARPAAEIRGGGHGHLRCQLRRGRDRRPSAWSPMRATPAW